jgi:hypothetical protein
VQFQVRLQGLRLLRAVRVGRECSRVQQGGARGCRAQQGSPTGVLCLLDKHY